MAKQRKGPGRPRAGDRPGLSPSSLRVTACGPWQGCPGQGLGPEACSARPGPQAFPEGVLGASPAVTSTCLCLVCAKIAPAQKRPCWAGPIPAGRHLSGPFLPGAVWSVQPGGGRGVSGARAWIHDALSRSEPCLTSPAQLPTGSGPHLLSPSPPALDPSVCLPLTPLLARL